MNTIDLVEELTKIVRELTALGETMRKAQSGKVVRKSDVALWGLAIGMTIANVKRLLERLSEKQA